MRTTIFRSSRAAIALAVGALLAPTFAFSQNTPDAPATHVVKRGETLASLARQYLGDVHRWTEIYELNKSRIANPNQIPSGVTLRMPPRNKRLATAAAPAAPTRQTPVATPPAQNDTGRVRIRQSVTVDKPQLPPKGTPSAPIRQSRTAPAARPETALAPITRTESVAQVPTAIRTVFYQPVAGRPEGAAPVAPVVRAVRPTIRTGEYLAAPYFDRDGGALGAGAILSSAEVSAFPVTSSARTLTISDRVFIQPPSSGPSATKGDRYLAFMLGPTFYGQGQIVIPTGVLVVERSVSGEPVEARVIAAYQSLTSGQWLIPLGTVPPLSLPRPAATSAGTTTEVLWVSGSPALATLQSYVVVGAGSVSGLAIGDQITLERSATSPTPGAPIARAVVVRVMPRSATALVIEQAQAEIHPGVLVRVTAKMP